MNFAYADALTTADRIIFFKMATSQYAKKYSAIATHMPKPFSNRTGSGLHVHFHVADAKSGKNLFIDATDKRRLGLSKLAYHFLGGVLQHARALCAVASPTGNCCKRLQIGAGLYSSRTGLSWTPAFASYGDNNRTQMIRTAGPATAKAAPSPPAAIPTPPWPLTRARGWTASDAISIPVSQTWTTSTSARSARSAREASGSRPNHAGR